MNELLDKALAAAAEAIGSGVVAASDQDKSIKLKSADELRADIALAQDLDGTPRQEKVVMCPIVPRL